MAQACTLEKSVINLNVIREDSKNELLHLLDNAGKDICLILEPSLAGPLNHILVDGTGMLKNHGVRDFRELSKSKKKLSTECKRLVYIVRPSIKNMRMIAQQVKDKDNKGALVSVYCVPRQTLVCEEVLKREGVLASVTLAEFHLDLVPFDDDVLTLELEDSFRHLYLEHEKTHLITVAESVFKLQHIFGLIPHVKVKGEMSTVVYQMMQRFRKAQEVQGHTLSSVDPEIDTLVLLDRNVDLVSCVVTPLTYEGLIDEILAITNGYARVEAELIQDLEEEEKSKPDDPHHNDLVEMVSIHLNSNDQLYSDIRNLNIEQLGPYLAEQARDIRERYDEFRKNKDQSISEIREFVKRIPGLKENYKSLQQHINITEFIKSITADKSFVDLWMTERSMLEGDVMLDRIEEMMGNQDPLMKVLRLLCLQSLTQGGIKSKMFDHLRKVMLQTYGFECLLTLNNLEKLGLIRRRETLTWTSDSSSSFTGLRKSLHLINDSVNVLNPGDIAYVTSGYAPISCRIIEAALVPGGWKHPSNAMGHQLKHLPGPTAEFCQRPNISNGGLDTEEEEGELEEDSGERKVMLVYFIGGVTFMEIAALRYLSKQPDCPYDIVIATTKLINGNSLLGSLIDKGMESGLRKRM